MGRYRSSGVLDDPVVEDGDGRFVGMNQRLHPSQLGPGEVRLSRNGRIDGYWVPRRGVDVVSSVLDTSGTPLRLPFWLVDAVGGSDVTAASLTSGVVSLTVAGHGLGYQAFATGTLDPTGANNEILVTALSEGELFNGYRFTLFRASPSPANLPLEIIYTAGYTSYDFLFAGTYPPTFLIQHATDGSGNPLSSAQDVIDGLNAYAAFSNVFVASNAAGSDGTGAVSNTTVDTSGAVDGPANLTIEGLGFATTDPNGVRLVTATDSDTLTFPLVGADETFTIAGSDDKVLSKLNDTSYDSIFGSCVFSDPSDANNEFLMVAVNSFVAKISLADGTLEEVGYPGGETVAAEVCMLQCFDKVLILRDGLVAMDWSSGDTDFALVDSGTYTQPQLLTVTLDDVTVADALCTVTLTGDYTGEFAVGDLLQIYSLSDVTASGSPLAESATVWSDRRFPVVSCVYSSPSTTLTFYLPVGDTAAGSASDSLVLGRRVTVGGGFLHQPGMPWGVYFQRRLWGPYQHDWDTSAFASRDIKDEIIASDILDYNTFDRIENQYRVTAGIADHLVALHPFFDDALLVLNRNSLHLIAGTSGDLRDTSVKELTREVGCLARKSVVSHGNQVFFLSDNGIYAVGFGNDYNLRGVDRPLSENIQSVIDRVNYDLAEKSVGIYFNNRVWFAVPLDSAPRAGDAVGNNTVLVWNVLNQAWESEDTYGVASFLILDFHIGYSETRNDLYAVTESGGVHALDILDESYDNVTTGAAGERQIPVDSVLQTRGFMHGTMDRKRFSAIEVAMQSGSAQSDMSVGFSTDDPDSISTLSAVSDTLGSVLAMNDSASVRMRTGGVRGYNGSVTLTRIFGRPKITAVKTQAILTNRATISQQ